MNFKRFLCLTLCLALLLLTVGCRQSDSDFSSAGNSSTISVSQSTQNSETNDSSVPQSDTSSVESEESSSTQSDSSEIKDEENSSSTDSSTESKDEENSSSTDSSTESVDMEATYGFNSIEGVIYNRVRNIPNYDVIYEVTEVLTDKEQDISLYTEIICDEKAVTIDGKNIILPYSFFENNDSLNLTARHRASGVEYNFEINIKADQWHLTFEDEFEGDTLNTDLWGNIRETDNEYEWRENFSYAYKKDSVFLDGKGNLINRVTALKEKNSAGNPIYTTSLISTKDCFESKYGYYEMRAIPHRENGMWGAFWILAGDMDSPDAVEDYSSANGIEIDIFETLYGRNTARHALFWDGYYNNQTKKDVFGGNEIPNLFDGKYHTFALQWTPEEFIFFVDGNETWRSSAAGGCQEPGYLLISSHINTDIDDVSLKPGEHSDMIVDYVRIYTNDAYNK